MSLPSPPDGSSWSSRWPLDRESSAASDRATTQPHRPPPPPPAITAVTTTEHSQPTAVHLVAGVVAVHLLIALAGVGDAASVSALELIGGAQRGWKRAGGRERERNFAM